MQKAILFLVFVIVAVGTCALVLWAVSKRPAQPPANSQPSAVTPASTEKIGVKPSDAPTSGKAPEQPVVSQSPSESTPIAPPRTEQQKEQDNVESRRTAFYRQSREQAGDEIESMRPKEEERSTLDVTRSEANPKNLLPLIDLLVRTGAYRNGFRHIRIFAPNPAGTLDRVRLEAEANANEDGNWFTFRK